jgi:hypothetical protein
LKLYIYPLLNRETGELTTVENIEIPSSIRKLYEYLVEKNCIEQLDNHNPQCLSTFSREVLKMIQAGDMSWTEHVPDQVAELIQRRGYFGFRRPKVVRQTPPLSLPIGQGFSTDDLFTASSF